MYEHPTRSNPSTLNGFTSEHERITAVVAALPVVAAILEEGLLTGRDPVRLRALLSIVDDRLLQDTTTSTLQQV